MQILGIYEYHGNEVEFLETVRRLHVTQLHLPVVITFERDCFADSDFDDRISIFPAFYTIDRQPTIHQVLAETFDKSQSSYAAAKISRLTIYLVDSFDMSSIQVFTKNMTMTFPEIIYLGFCFENQCEIVSLLLAMIVRELKSICVISANT